MRVVFMGTPDFAVPSLQALLDAGHEVAAVASGSLSTVTGFTAMMSWQE